MEIDQLRELRNKIVRKTQELALNGEGSASERLEILMNIVRSGGASVEVLSKVYELTESLEGDDDKLTALLDVLYEVDAQLGSLEQASAPPQGDAAEPQQPQHTQESEYHQ